VKFSTIKKFNSNVFKEAEGAKLETKLLARDKFHLFTLPLMKAKQLKEESRDTDEK
jgi:hypothetical protein